MKRIVATVMGIFMLLALNAQAKSTTYGKGVTVQETTLVSAILATPGQYVGKKVKIKGMITEVCAKRGCWVYVAGDKPYEKIQIKVVDGEIVFPMSASGRLAEVEGVVEELKMTKEEVMRWKKHQAEETGKPFDPASVKGDETMIRIKGSGAVVEE